MARVVVVGGGFGGLASAARLARLGHEVTLLERRERLGGALGSVSLGDFTWDTGPSATLLPAVLRDLLRKTGRPAERELELVPVDPVREHRFADGSRVSLPGGSRAGQIAALEGLGPGLGWAWASYVDGLAEPWELLRRNYLETPWSDLADPRAARVLSGRQSLHRLLRGSLPDPRLREIAAHPHLAEGHDLRRVPAWAGVVSYLEQRFGAWTVPGGLGALAEVLARRLATRRVAVSLGTDVRDVLVTGGRVAGVLTEAGALPADVVVCAVDPRRLPALAGAVRRTSATTVPAVTHVGLRGPVPGLAAETVLHGDPVLVVRSGTDGAWTILVRGPLDRDVLDVLAERGVDVRASVVERLDRTAAELTALWGGSPFGVRWEGRDTARRRLGPRTPVPGLYAAGAHAVPGAGLPYVGLSAALVAQAVGPA